MGEYRMVPGIGSYFNRRWEIQKKYSYYEYRNGTLEKIEVWHMVFCCSDKEQCERVLHRYQTDPPKRLVNICEDNELPFMA